MNQISYDLIKAVHGGRLEVVKDLVNQYGLSHSAQWGHGYVLLRDSIERNHTEIAKWLINNGAKVNSKRSETVPSTSPLHFAVENGDKEIIEMLLNRGANINAEDAGCQSPLLWATKLGKEDIVEILLSNGANVGGNKNGTTPLHVAVQYDFPTIVEKLIKHGSYVNSTCNDYYSRKGFTPLHLAVEGNKDKMVVLLLSHGANVNAGSLNMTTPLHIATRKEYFTIVELLLKKGVCVNSKTTEGLTPLHLASENGNVKLMKLLLSNNAEVDPFTNDKMTPLCIAIKGLNREAAKLLMDHGANVDVEFENGNKILSFAVGRGSTTIVKDILQHFPDKNDASNKNALKIAAKCSEKKYVTIVEELLEYGFSVEPDDINDSSLLHNCVEMGYIKILEDLLKHGIDLSCNKDQNTLLHIAAKSKQNEVAKFLLTHGADVNATDKSGKPPIFYSTENSDVITTKVLLLHGANIQKSPELLRVATKKVCKEMVEVLLQNQADIEATDKFGRTALHLTASSEYDGCLGLLFENEPNIKAKGEIAKLLLSKGANVNAKTDKDGLTALHIASQKSFTNVVEILLEYKADVDCIVKDFTPLHIASRNGKEQIVEMLLKNGANVNSRRENGETSLHIAAKIGHLGVLKMLLHCDADIESEDINGATPLHSAVTQDKCEIVSVLLQHGALIDSQDKEGNTALHIASKLGKIGVLRLLLKLGSDINILTNNNCTPTDLANHSYYSQRPQIDFYDSEDEYIDLRGGHGHRSHEYIEVIEILKLHLIMLKTANLYINEKYLHFLNAVPEMVALYEREYKEEIEKLKNEKMGSTKVSLYDILTKNISSLAKYARNKDIRRIMDSNSYKVSFPIYAGIIERNFKRGVERCRLLDQAQEFFTVYFELPYCSNEILSYLSDGDLKNIINI